MSASFSFTHEEGNDFVSVHIKILDDACLNCNATFCLQARVKVNDSDPVHAKNTLFEQNFTIGQKSLTLTIPLSTFSGFTYTGEKIKTEYQGTLTIDDSLFFFDTKVKETITKLLDKPKVNTDAKQLIEPRDTFDFIHNLKAIPPHRQLHVIGLIVVATIAMALNTLCGLHDAASPPSATIFYSHTDSDGEPQSPLLASLTVTVAMGVALMIAI